MIATGCGVQESAESKTDAIIKLTTESAPASIPVVQDEAAANADTETDENLTQAKSAIETFANALQVELVSAMQENGPVNALGVCHTRAQPVAREVSEEHGMQLSRVSLKNRNPANAPNDWQTHVLQEFERRKATGEPIADLSYLEVVGQGNARQFRYMKAIPIRAVCLTCHGTDMAPDVKARLLELYPDDKATGYEYGDIRGAFVVVKDIVPSTDQE